MTQYCIVTKCTNNSSCNFVYQNSKHTDTVYFVHGWETLYQVVFAQTILKKEILVKGKEQVWRKMQCRGEGGGKKSMPCSVIFFYLWKHFFFISYQMYWLTEYPVRFFMVQYNKHFSCPPPLEIFFWGGGQKKKFLYKETKSKNLSIP